MPPTIAPENGGPLISRAVPRFTLDSLAEPIVQAPLAGGPSTPALAAAVSEAGGLGFLATGYKAAEAARGELEALRAETSRPFGVNLFVPSPAGGDPTAVDRYARDLSSEAERYGAQLGTPRHDDDAWDDKLALVEEARVAVVSFTFGCPDAAAIERLQGAGAAVWVTVTTAAEARAAAAAGADALVVQGIEAGGHRASFVDADPAGDYGLLALLQLVAARTDLPLVASGGIASGAAVAAVLCAGARAAQIGTAFMRCPEAGTAAAHRDALATAEPTRLTRAFSGRNARGIVNRFLREHSADAPIAYPEIHHVTAPLRAAGRKAGDADVLNLWAGQAHELARDLPAGELVAALAAEAARCVEAAGRALGGG